MDEKTKEDLVWQFRDYLDRVPEEQQSCESPDMFSFYSELIALKNEVKIESRLVKNGLDEFRQAVTLMASGSQTISKRLEQNEMNRTREFERSHLHSVFIGILDIYDSLAAAGQVGQKNKPSFLSRFCGREMELIKAMQEGQEMTLFRVNDLLRNFRIRPIEALGRSFDPLTMRAVATGTDPLLPDAVVSAELRKGFLWKDELLRFADVKVNKNL